MFDAEARACEAVKAILMPLLVPGDEIYVHEDRGAIEVSVACPVTPGPVGDGAVWITLTL